MTDQRKQMHEDSAAFRQALLQSEKKRIIAVVAFVLFFTVLSIIRIFVFGSAMSRWGLLAGAVLIGYELVVLRTVNQALLTGRELSQAVWFFSIVLETLFPAVGTAFLVSPRLEVLYRPLATPWVLAFLPFLMLSVLRLSPRLSRVAGIVATAGYLAAAYHHGWKWSVEGTAGYTVTQTAVLYYALILLASGFLAGGIAAEIRKHVEAALREAETRHQLQQVEHDLQIAKSIQQSLLPKVRPNIVGYEVAGWSRSADDTGGDFYDWKRMPDGRLVVMLADVTGHGIGPAMLASVCRAYSRASFNSRDSLMTTLQNINQSFAEDLTPERFATFVAAVCRDGDDRVELLSAGHGPLFVYSSESRNLRYFEAQTLPLGIVPEMVAVTPVILDMKAGDMVLLITDGFFEWENPAAELYGLERLADTVRKFGTSAPEEIIAELYQSVLTFSQGTKQKDDLTAVIIKRSPGKAVPGVVEVN